MVSREARQRRDVPHLGDERAWHHVVMTRIARALLLTVAAPSRSPRPPGRRRATSALNEAAEAFRSGETVYVGSGRARRPLRGRTRTRSRARIADEDARVFVAVLPDGAGTGNLAGQIGDAGPGRRDVRRGRRTPGAPRAASWTPARRRADPGGVAGPRGRRGRRCSMRSSRRWPTRAQRGRRRWRLGRFLAVLAVIAGGGGLLAWRSQRKRRRAARRPSSASCARRRTTS